MAIWLSTTAGAINLTMKLHNSNYYYCGIQEISSSTIPHCCFPSEQKKKKYNKRFPYVSLVSKKHRAIGQILNERNRNDGKSLSPRQGARRVPLLSEGTEEDEDIGHICPGCGVFLQDKDPNFPGYHQKRKAITSSAERDVLVADSDQEAGDAAEDQFEEPEPDDDDSGGGLGENNEEDFGRDSVKLGNVEEMDEKVDKFNWDFDEFAAATLKTHDSDLDLDGFTPAGVGYGNLTEEVMERERKKKEGRKVSKAEKKRIAREAAKKEKDEDVTVCARCHSLRNYGQVKNQAAENLIPDFDFDRLIATRLMKPSGNGNATVVVMVIDCVDFDGSFPKRAAKSLFEALEAAKNDPRASKKLPKLVLVATKVDLLPSQISPTRLDRWVRHRAREGGAPKLSGVYLVSARRDLGMKNLLSFIKELAGPRGNVWVIGAQNAGKSTLINVFAKKEGAKVTKLTEAAVPGTTLGILRIRGILSAKAKMYDTPGLLHPYLMSMRLNRDEQKMTEIRKELQPRTYRMKVGQAVHVGGLVRLDLNQASVETIYVTVWASPNVSLHLGKIENADDFWRNHVGVRLQPPVGNDRASELGKWEENEIKVAGASWDVSSIDIAVAGLGWFSLGLKGEATLKLWTYDGIEITMREPLVLDRAPFLERPGFWLPKAVSDAIGNQAALEAQKRKMLQESSEESLLEIPA